MHNNNHSPPDDEGISPARVVPYPDASRFTVLVANAKGGCGKTTLATNLASAWAASGRAVTLLDLDPQQSAGIWVKQRNASGAPPIQPLALGKQQSPGLGAISQLLRDSHEFLVIDSPAGLEGPMLDACLRLAHVVLVPVLPSPIDTRAVTRFMQAVMLSSSYRRRPRRLAVIANRARERTRMYGQLRLFLNSLKVPFLTTLRDTQLYVQAVDEGLGIMELEEARAAGDRQDWQAILDWLEVQKHLMRAWPGLR